MAVPAETTALRVATTALLAAVIARRAAEPAVTTAEEEIAAAAGAIAVAAVVAAEAVATEAATAAVAAAVVAANKPGIIQRLREIGAVGALGLGLARSAWELLKNNRAEATCRTNPCSIARG